MLKITFIMYTLIFGTSPYVSPWPPYQNLLVKDHVYAQHLKLTRKSKRLTKEPLEVRATNSHGMKENAYLT